MVKTKNKVMENTRENFNEFAALYTNQEVGRDWLETKIKIGNYGTKTVDYLSLIHYRDISDEDASTFADIWRLMSDNYFMEKLGHSRVEHVKRALNEGLNFVGIDLTRAEHMISFLRGKGYAVPYRGVTIETMIHWQWVKLKDLQYVG